MTQAAWLAVFVVTVMMVVICLGPIFTIWSLNTLFGLHIPYTFSTWIAALWMTMVVGGGISVGKKNS